MTEKDFNLVKGRDSTVVFQVFKEDGVTPHVMTGSTVVIRVYKTVPVDLPATIGGASGNQLTVEFGNTVNSATGTFEWEAIQTPAVGDLLYPIRGNVTFDEATNFTTQIPVLIDTEAMGLVIDPNYKTQAIVYWKYFLQEAFDISDELLLTDAAWPVLARFLIAKLVIHDYIVNQIRGSITGTFTSSSSASGKGQLKALEVGPSKAEWYNNADTLKNLLKTGAGGASAFDQFKADICALAGKLRVYLPLCGEVTVPVVPGKAGRTVTVTDEILILTDIYG